MRPPGRRFGAGAKRCIHPLFVATGLRPFEGDRKHFFAAVQTLLEANVHYCLLGDDSKYVALIEQARGAALEGGTCQALDKFKAKFMPFFVEDYRWTSANFANMSQRGEEFARWWRLAQPVVEAAGPGSWVRRPSTLRDDTPHLPAWCLLGLRPLLRTPEHRLSCLEACRGPRFPLPQRTMVHFQPPPGCRG